MNNLIKKIVESKFNFNIDIEDSERQNSLSKSFNISKSQKQAYINQYIVDLGLPSGTKWCRYNLGVDLFKLNKPEDWYGGYYAWGELKPKDQYAWETYKFGHISHIEKYNNTDKLKQLQLEDDAAYQNLHIGNLKFKIPTKYQLDELLDQTSIKWVENYNNINRLNGILFTSKTNNNKMFIPTAGYCYYSKLFNVGVVAYLRSSNLNTDYIGYAWSFYFNSKQAKICNYSRCYGMSVRPVLYKN